MTDDCKNLEVYLQHPILADKPSGWGEDDRPTGIDRYILRRSSPHSLLSFEYKKLFVYRSALLQPDDTTRRLDIAVPRGCDLVIQIYLDESTEWRWSNKFDAITVKNEPDSDEYGELRYCRWFDDFSDPTMMKCRNEFHEKDDLRGIQFKARSDFGSSNVGKNHSFCLNIDVEQVDKYIPTTGQFEVNSMLPITIDPDVRNPPPGGDDLFDSLVTDKDFSFGMVNGFNPKEPDSAT